MDAMVRNVSPRDREALMEMRNLTGDELEARFDDQEQGGSEWLVAECEGTPGGWVQLFWNEERTGPGVAKIEDLWIAESMRDRGLGTCLLIECENRARERGREKIWLEVNPEHNQRARALYERLGYVHDGEALHLDGVYDGFEDWVINLEKRLD